MTLTSFNQDDRNRRTKDHPLFRLSEDDLNLITQLALFSGSMKSLAKTYGVSYPTIRIRLDAVIERLKEAVEGQDSDPVTELLASLVERGELTGRVARSILDSVHTQNRKGENEC